MIIKDHDNIFNQLSKNKKHGKLAILDAPTGSGKSYSIIDFLCNRAVKNQKFRAFFVTDQKKNLSLDLFQDRWVNQKSLVDNLNFPFYKKIAVIRSLTDTVKLVINDFEKNNIPEVIMTTDLVKSLEDLRDSLNLYEIIQGQNSNSINGWYDLSKMEFAFRKALAKELMEKSGIISEDQEFGKKECQNKIRDYLKTAPTDLQKWIYETYPTIDLQNYQIFLCTTDKFISSYTSFFKFGGELFLYSDLIEDSLVVLDEFDSTKARIWDKSLNDVLTIQVDLLVLFDIIFQGLKRIDENIPQKLNDILIEGSANTHYLEIAKKLDQEFKLSYLYKVTGLVLPNTYVIHTPVNNIFSEGKYWYSHFILEDKQVMIDHQSNENLHFNSMLNRVSKFIKSFNQYVLNCARKYMKKRNGSIGSLDSAINQVDACWTVYRALRLDDNQIKMLMNSSLSGWKKKTKSNSNFEKVDNSYEFQKNGLELYCFSNSEQHDLQTEINASFLTTTAENYLLTLVKKCLVYGLSATASIPTVLDNYDMEYLKEKLGHNFINGRDYLTPDTIRKFDYIKRYQKHQINVGCEVVGMYGNIESLIKDKVKDKEIDINWNEIKKIDSEFKKVQNLIDSNDEKDISYFKQRYMSLFESFVYFLLDPQLTTFLGLQSKLPDNTSEMYQKLIQKVFEILSDQFNKTKDVKLCFISNEEGDIQEKLQEALKYPAKKIRVYLLSAYLSIGVGQNLQHNLTDDEKSQSECIAFSDVNKSDERLKQIDLAGIYLGEVTHILTKVEDFQLNFDVLKYVTELEYLRDADELGPKEFAKQISYLEKKTKYMKSPRKVPSRQASYTRVIIQALGRMNRTFNKVKNPLVLAHNNVIRSVSFLGLNPNLFSPEFNAIMNKKDQFNKCNQIDQRSIEKENYTAYTLRDTNQLVFGLKNADENMIEEYKRVRRILLKFPTISSKKLKEVQKSSDKCLQYLKNFSEKTNYIVKIESLDKGFFDFNLNKNTNDEKLFEVSSASSGLDTILKYGDMLNYFEQNGYATNWNKNEYIMNPIQNISLYRGILGEVAGKYILKDALKIELLDFKDFKNVELFDFKVLNKNVAIDFKNWTAGHLEDRGRALEEVRYKLNLLNKNTNGLWKVIIINILGDAVPKITVTGDGSIMEVPALINSNGKLVLDLDMKKNIEEFLNERIRDNSN